MWRFFRLVFAFLTFGPLLLWLAGIITVIVLTRAYGCELDEGGIHPCIVNGEDIGQTAAEIAFLTFFGPVFIGPIVGLAAMAWIASALIRRLWLSRRAG